jgi:hypothetical protein
MGQHPAPGHPGPRKKRVESVELGNDERSATSTFHPSRPKRIARRAAGGARPDDQDVDLELRHRRFEDAT